MRGVRAGREGAARGSRGRQRQQPAHSHPTTRGDYQSATLIQFTPACFASVPLKRHVADQEPITSINRAGNQQDAAVVGREHRRPHDAPPSAGELQDARLNLNKFPLKFPTALDTSQP